MAFAVRRADGKFLGRGTGARRSWVTDIDDADTWDSPGRAKVSYNHVCAPIRRSNEWNARRAANLGEPLVQLPLPSFEAVEVRISLVVPD